MIDRVAKSLLQPLNTSMVVILSFYNFLLGLWLVMPFATVSNRLGSWPIWLIGSILIFIGIFMLLGIILDKYRYILIGAGSGVIFWTACTSLLMYSNFFTAGWIIPSMMAIYCGLVFVNLKVNRRFINDK